MYISLQQCGAAGFRKWSEGHPPASNDNPTDIPEADALVKPREVPRGPWLAPDLRHQMHYGQLRQ